MREGIVSTGIDQLLYLRVTEACNAYCRHCFIPKNPKTLDLSTLTSGLDEFRLAAKEGQRVLVQLHGGEPSLVGPQRLANICEMVRETLKGFHVQFGIQTNLIRLDEELIAFYEEYISSGHFGVSWDTEIRTIRKVGIDSNIQFERVFWENFARLSSTSLKPVVVMTATKQFFERFFLSGSLYKFARERNIRELHIERLTKTGYARENWDYIGVSNLEHSLGMSQIFNDYLVEKINIKPIFTSPFDGLMGSVEKLHSGNHGGYGCWSGSCDTRFHTIDMNGYKKGCTAINSESDNPSVSDDVQVIKLIDIGEARAKRQEMMCEKCRYRPICSSGCLASDGKDESEECSGHHFLFSTLERSFLEGKTHEN